MSDWAGFPVEEEFSELSTVTLFFGDTLPPPAYCIAGTTTVAFFGWPPSFWRMGDLLSELFLTFFAAAAAPPADFYE